MVRNYLIVALRNLLKHKLYSLINVLGLAIGMACCILILLFIQDEFSYDCYHEKADQIYRVLRETRTESGPSQVSALTSGPVGPALAQDFPEVRQATRMMLRPNQWTRHEDTGFTKHLCLVEPDLFEIFDFPLVKGDLETALRDPYAALITEETAREYFGDEDPMGKELVVEGRVFPGMYTVTGILKDLPKQTTLRFDLVHSTVPKNGPYRNVWENWQDVSWREVQTFVVLPQGYDPDALERKLSDFMAKYMGEEVRKGNSYYLQPLTRMHLYSRVDYGMGRGGDIDYIYMLSAVALFIMLIACINFMNLATARSASRAQEVGMRKVVGAYRRQLIKQFLGESIIQAFLAILMAVGLAELVLPGFGSFMNRQLSLSAVHAGRTAAGLLSFALVVGLLAGIYPAFFLSAFQPVAVLKGHSGAPSQGVRFRQGLVVFQFAMSILLMVSTAVVYDQLAYMRNKDLGFDRDHIVILPIFNVESRLKDESQAWLADRYPAVKQAFFQHPNVLKASAFRFWLGHGGGMIRQIRAEDHENQAWRMPVQEADPDFLETFGVNLLAGRTFSSEDPVGERGEFLLNETAVRNLGWTVDGALGKSFQAGSIRGSVIGVFKDYHYGPLRQKIGPTAIRLRARYFSALALKVRAGNIPETLAFLESTWKQFVPEEDFEFHFLDETLDWAYRSEARFAQITGTFSLISIFVACLGLLGLAMFTTEQRTREIGIRKVLGASVSSLVLLLSSEFMKLVVVANMIAWPVAYYWMNSWLQNFAYRTELGIRTFAFGGILAAFIVLATISFQAIKVATANPVDTLRNE